MWPLPSSRVSDLISASCSSGHFQVYAMLLTCENCWMSPRRRYKCHCWYSLWGLKGSDLNVILPLPKSVLQANHTHTGSLLGAITLKKMKSSFSLLSALHLSKTPHLGVGPCGPPPTHGGVLTGLILDKSLRSSTAAVSSWCSDPAMSYVFYLQSVNTGITILVSNRLLCS